MLDEEAAANAGWHKCVSGEWSKIFGNTQIFAISAKAALEYETTRPTIDGRGDHWR